MFQPQSTNKIKTQDRRTSHKYNLGFSFKAYTSYNEIMLITLFWLLLLINIRQFRTVCGWVPSYPVGSSFKNDANSCDKQCKNAMTNVYESRISIQVASIKFPFDLSATTASNNEGDSRIDDDYRDFQVTSETKPADVEFRSNESIQNRTVNPEEGKKIDLKSKQKDIEHVVRKKIGVARAQAEIDRILTGPDAPCDLDGEWDKVSSIAAINVEEVFTSMGDSNNSTLQSIDGAITNQIRQQQIQSELACQELEHDLHSAIQSNDFDLAMSKKHCLDRMQMDHGNAVLQLNAAFYKAFSSKDYKSMSTIWIPDSTATCILPTYKKPLIGNRAVLRNWQVLFESKNANAAFQRSWIEPSNIHISTIGSSSMVIVTCNENVYVRRFIRGKKRQTVHVNTIQATNIFRKVAGIWYLQYHHASSITSVPIVRNLEGMKNTNDSFDKSKRRSMIYDKNMFDESEDEEEEEEIEQNGIEAILGIKNLNADIGMSGKQQPSSVQPRQIIMGGLSDLLNGNLGNLLSGASSENKGARGDENQKGFAIIRVSRKNNDDADDFDEDEDDEGDDDEDDDQFGDGLENLQILSDNALNIEKTKIAESITIDKYNTDADSDNKMKKKDKQEQVREIQPKGRDEIMRIKCISSLRKLTQQGLLSPSHKRVLLTDIITRAVSTKTDDNYNDKASSTQKSVVQVAYELLLGSEFSPSSSVEGNKQDDEWKSIAEEEFAEQCRLFADELM